MFRKEFFKEHLSKQKEEFKMLHKVGTDFLNASRVVSVAEERV
jgi:hypothetical protein